jgi:hypothetical protein
MGTYSNWLSYITDPNSIDTALYSALAALDVVIDRLHQSQYIEFSSIDELFNNSTTNVSAGLGDLANAINDLTSGKVSAISGYVAGALIDSQVLGKWPMTETGELGNLYVFADVAPVVTPLVIEMFKNDVSQGTLSIDVETTGPISDSFGFVTYTAGDIIKLTVKYVSSAEGIGFTLER